MFILLSLPMLSFSLVYANPAEDSNHLKELVKTAGNLSKQINASSAPEANCNHSTPQFHSRQPLIQDGTVRVIVCHPQNNIRGESDSNINQLISDYNISFHPESSRASIISSMDFRHFVGELRKFPPNLLNQMAQAGSRITLIRGTGVSNDPAWEQERLARVEHVRRYGRGSEEEKARQIAEINQAYLDTFDGRSWSYTTGAGGNFSDPNWNTPTRIVVNHMYSNNYPLRGGGFQVRQEGSVNLFLHEHAHALDNFYRAGTISNSREWLNIRNDPSVARYLRKIFTSYEFDNLNEGFAEAFAYFFACEASRNQMRAEAPRLARFFEQLAYRSMTDFRPASE